MSIMPILKYPDPLLRKISEPVTEFDEGLAMLAADMKETMLAAPGAGLAAPQVGVLKRLILIDDRDDPEEDYGSKVLALVNPEITHYEGAQCDKEGCLSVVDLSADVNRHDLVVVAYHDLEGNPRTIKARGHKSVILQHETDHLDGVLFLDHLTPLRREIYVKSLRKKRHGEG
ncbi:MAG: peptide deformylase [Deltaproteobacteria bacterium]|jgi:peptide deformylase|nr:peptide deformylase [Deltaproteobacteria bacterium]